MTDVARYSATMLAQFSGRELNAVEELLAKRREAYDENTWFHGGYPGLNFGDVLMPPTTTGYVPMQQMLVDLHMVHGDRPNIRQVRMVRHGAQNRSQTAHPMGCHRLVAALVKVAGLKTKTKRPWSRSIWIQERCSSDMIRRCRACLAI